MRTITFVLLGACAAPVTQQPIGGSGVRPGALLSPIPAQVLEDPDAVSFGLDVSGGADLDADGRPDLVVGGPGGSFAGGRVGHYTGRAGGVRTPAAAVLTDGDSCFGQEVAIVGDLNGDGHPDVLSNDSCSRLDDSRILVTLGGTDAFDGVPDQVLTHTAFLGMRIVPAGDVDGDGRDDVVLSHVDAETGATSFRLHRGTAQGLAPQPFDVVHPTQAGRVTGNVAVGLDLDGDGHGDLVVFEHAEDVEAEHVWVVGRRGGPDGYDDAPWFVFEARAGTDFGADLASAGDVDGDGDDELLVGERWWRGGRGRVHVYLGGPTRPTADADQILEGPDRPEALFGDGLLGAGDLNGDGFGDVLVRAYMIPGRPSPGGPGRVYAYAGGPTGLETTPRQWIDGFGPRDMFAYAMAPAGDVDGDGRGDAWIAAYNENVDADELREGRVYLFAGAVDGDGDGHAVEVDCDDGDASVHPGAEEVPGDGVDQDCDGDDATVETGLGPGDTDTGDGAPIDTGDGGGEDTAEEPGKGDDR